jgi:hypothetical protein
MPHRTVAECEAQIHLGEAHPPARGVLHAPVAAQREEGAGAERVSGDGGDRRQRKDEYAREQSVYAGNKGGRLGRVRAEPLEIEPVGEELGVADQQHARARRARVRVLCRLGLDLYIGFPSRFIYKSVVSARKCGVARSTRVRMPRCHYQLDLSNLNRVKTNR